MDVLFIYLLFLLGYIVSIGIFNLSGLAIIVICFFLLLFRKPQTGKTSFYFPLLLFSLGLSLLFDHLLYPSQANANQIIKLLLMAASFLSLLYLYPNKILKQKQLFILLLIIGLGIRALIIFFSPNPQIDVYYLIKEAPLLLKEGLNPYSSVYTRVYQNVTPDYYTYFPFSFVFFYPFSTFLNDPRWGYLLIYVLLSYLIPKTVKNKLNGQLLALLVVFQPLSLLVFEQGFIEILLLGLIFLIYYFLRKKRTEFALIIFGLALATKQTMILLFPFLGRLLIQKKDWFKKLLLIFAPFVLIILPFLIWDFRSFYYDTIYYLLHMDLIRTDMIGLSLNMISLIYKATQIYLSQIPFYTLIVLFLIYLLFKNRLGEENLSLSLYNIALFFLAFHLLATQAYVNYFFLIGNLLIFSQIFAQPLHKD